MILKVIIQQKAAATDRTIVDSKAVVETLKRLSISPPIRIPNSQNSFIQFGKLPEPLKSMKWKIFAWRISGNNI
ncbi:hypothetical protein SNE40_005415 [Patella caerulea]|uniref:Uncharacterized protein n=1 Tax=Patella caerulea TaxID=87958 RepID=A0AAN8JWY2_PATCE